LRGSDSCVYPLLGRSRNLWGWEWKNNVFCFFLGDGVAVAVAAAVVIDLLLLLFFGLRWPPVFVITQYALLQTREIRSRAYPTMGRFEPEVAL